MDETQRAEAVLQAFQAARFRECLALAAPMLVDGQAPGPILLAAAQAYAKLDHLPEAAHFYHRAALALPEAAPLLLTLAARIQSQLRNDSEALRLLRLAQDHGPLTHEALFTLRRILRTQLALEELAALDGIVHQAMLAGEAWAFEGEDPLFHLMWCGDERLNSLVTHMPTGKPFTPESRMARRTRPHRFGERIRVGYLSADVSDQHPTMILFQGVLFAHDPAKFDVRLFCYTEPDLSATDHRFRRDYPNLVDIQALDDDAAEALIRAHELDILVDLKGHTRDSRVDLVNRGLAPVQVAYMGFPGSSHGVDCDYMIGDAIVLRDGSRAFYHELYCRMPDSYQANDCRLRPLPPALSKAEAGLPKDAFVYASFNKVAKITADMASLWAEVLKRTPGSVLWVLCAETVARDNFTNFMVSRGIAADRIIYAGRTEYEAHVARMQAADVALDTFPYTGHTTTSDSLWAGVPVVALKGTNFASRVSESLLSAIGLEALVADTPSAFVDMAVSLYEKPERLAGLRRHLAEQRFIAPLFDTDRFTGHLEIAFEHMVARARAGLPPEAFDVPPLPPRTKPFCLI